MNAIYFVSVVAILAFATGLFVATIIWGINWVLKPKSNTISMSLENLVHLILNPKLFNEYQKTRRASEPNYQNMTKEDLTNKEIYTFYHGKN